MKSSPASSLESERVEAHSLAYLGVFLLVERILNPLPPGKSVPPGHPPNDGTEPRVALAERLSACADFRARGIGIKSPFYTDHAPAAFIASQFLTRHGWSGFPEVKSLLGDYAAAGYLDINDAIGGLGREMFRTRTRPDACRPAELAIANGHQEAFELLLEMGVDLSLPPTCDWRSLDLRGPENYRGNGIAPNLRELIHTLPLTEQIAGAMNAQLVAFEMRKHVDGVQASGLDTSDQSRPASRRAGRAL
ncbi:hypothetical protein [Paucibacter soli]|uniref:hypothetical protein n=1 Tax=Paucibacter soli TaxID=3133433 RepID=UPI003097ACE8